MNVPFRSVLGDSHYNSNSILLYGMPAFIKIEKQSSGGILKNDVQENLQKKACDRRSFLIKLEDVIRLIFQNY